MIVYRCYDRSQQLLYVGFSLQFAKRLSQHQLSRHWFKKVDSIRLHHCQTFKAGCEIEAKAIKNEQPLYNHKQSLMARHPKNDRKIKEKSSSHMTVEVLMKYFKVTTQFDLGEKLGVRPQAISYWVRTDRIPPTRQAIIQIMTNGKLRADKPKRNGK